MYEWNGGSGADGNNILFHFSPLLRPQGNHKSDLIIFLTQPAENTILLPK